MWYTVPTAFLLCAGLVYGQLSLRSPSSGLLAADFQEGTAIVNLGYSSDRQSYFALLNTGEITFRVALDTASSDLWILSSNCEDSSCDQLPRYPLSYDSPTFSSVNENNTVFSVSYADTTTASGFVAQESVSVGNLTVNSQAFGLVTSTNVSLVDQVSGVLGLGFPRLSSISNSVTNSTPFFVALAQQGLLNYPLFGLHLASNSSGTLAIGAIDGSVVTNVSRIEWHDVVEFPPIGAESNVSSYLHWVISLAAISINNTDIKPTPTYPSRGTSLALLDVGTPGIYGPYQDVSRLFDLIESSRLVDTNGLWAIPCDSNFTMSFTFGTRKFTLQPTEYLIGPAEGNPNLCLSWPLALPPSSDGIDWQLGGAFLRTVYAIFSYGINTKEPPMIGLYSTRKANTSLIDSPSSVSAYFSSLSITLPTTLPNFPLATPTYTTPTYGFNSSISAPTGGIVKTALATSSYNAVLGGQHTNLSAIPTITPTPTLLTFLITDASGLVQTSVSTVTETVTLGVPPGWSSASMTRVPTTISLAFGLIIAVSIVQDICI